MSVKKRILYKNKEGTVSVVIPCDPRLSIEDIIKKDVPAGVEYVVVDQDMIPSDREDRHKLLAYFA